MFNNKDFLVISKRVFDIGFSIQKDCQWLQENYQQSARKRQINSAIYERCQC